MDRYTVISADCHAGADLLDYRDYLDPQYRDEFDSWAKTYVNPFGDLTEPDAEHNWNSDRRNSELDSGRHRGGGHLPQYRAAVLSSGEPGRPSTGDRPRARAALGRPACAQSLAGRLLLLVA